MNGQIVLRISHPSRWGSFLKRGISTAFEEIKSTVAGGFFSLTRRTRRIRIYDFTADDHEKRRQKRPAFASRVNLPEGLLKIVAVNLRRHHRAVNAGAGKCHISMDRDKGRAD